MDKILDGRQIQRHPPIREQVAGLIRDAIIEMRLKPGEVLIERELCEMTGASRPSVREALRQLEAEMLVLSLNGKGTIVAVPDLAVARGVYDVNVELEGVAAEVFVTRASSSDRIALREALNEVASAVEQNEDTNTIAMLHLQFFEALLAGTQNEVLAQTLSQLRNRVSSLIYKSLELPGRREQTVHELSAIVQSIESNDPAASRRTAASHAQQVAHAIFTSLTH